MPTFSFSVAGLGLSVSCQDTELVEVLAQRYRAFPEVGQVDFALRVAVGGEMRRPGFDPPRFTFIDGELRFADPDFRGSIDERAARGSLTLPSASLEGVEYFLRVAVALLAFRRGGFLFHAAGVLRRGRAYLFFGHSGSGKTTAARLSAAAGLDPPAVVLNDDLLVVLPSQSGWTVYATPFWNPTQVPPGSQSGALAGLYRLVQDAQVFLEAMTPGQALAEAVSSVPVIPEDPRRSVELLSRLQKLVQSVPTFRLHFRRDPSFWEVIDSWQGPEGRK